MLNIQRQRRIFDCIGTEIGVRQHSDWYRVTTTELERHGIYFQRGSGGLSRLLPVIYPEWEWCPWKFTSESCRLLPLRWTATQQRHFFAKAADLLGLNSLDEWHNVQQSQIASIPGGALLSSYYGGSLAKALESLYPQHPWQPWRFPRAPRGFWKSDTHAVSFLKWLAFGELRMLPISDWSYCLSTRHFVSLNGAPLLSRYRSLSVLLSLFCSSLPSPLEASVMRIYEKNTAALCSSMALHQTPHRGKAKCKDASTNSSFASRVTKAQRFILNTVNFLFPCESILFNYRLLKRFEVDIFIPSHTLAVEFQGEQHYKWHFIGGAPNLVQMRDLRKQKECEKVGITLVEIPFSWNFRIGFFVEIIHNHRPDLLFGIGSNFLSKGLIKPRRSMLRQGSPSESTAGSYFYYQQLQRWIDR